MPPLATGAPAAAFTIKVDGSDLPTEARGNVLDITVDERLDAPAAFSLELVNWDMDKQAVTFSDDRLFAPGAAVEIQLGHGTTTTKVVSGEVTGLELQLAERVRSILVVRGYDRLHRLRRGRHTKAFTQAKDSDLAKKLAGGAGLGDSVEDSGEVHAYLLQSDQTDLDFLLARARSIGYELLVDDKTLIFRKVRNARGKVETLSATGELLSVSAYLSTANQVSEVTVLGWDPKAKKALVGRAQDSDLNGTMGGQTSGPAATKPFGAHTLTVVEHPVATQKEADLLAKGFLNELALEYVVAEAELIGRPTLRAGAVVELDGLGKRFSGAYYLTRVRHRLGPNGYRTRLHARRNAA